MTGFITGKHLLTHGRIIIHEFGFYAWLKCFWFVLSGKPITFLAAVCLFKSKKLKKHPAFGLWRGRNIDALDYQRKLRDEWE